MRSSHFLPLILMVLFASLQTRCSTIREAGHGRNRIKRQECQDGYGDYKGQKCCKCPPGFHLDKCNGTCRACEDETYLDDANLVDSCERCTSCDPKANLETEEVCTRIQNAVCRCTKGYYCTVRVREECKVCLPCKICGDGFDIDKECTSTNDTVCKKAEGGAGGLWWIIFIILPMIGIIILIIIIYLKKQNRLCFADATVPGGAGEGNTEGTPLKEIDLVPHLNWIVDILGPKVTVDLARGDLTDGKIEFHEENAHRDAKEKSYKILKEWCELQSFEAAPKLIRKLNKMGKTRMAEDIMKKILAENEE